MSGALGEATEVAAIIDGGSVSTVDIVAAKVAFAASGDVMILSPVIHDYEVIDWEFIEATSIVLEQALSPVIKVTASHEVGALPDYEVTCTTDQQFLIEGEGWVDAEDMPDYSTEDITYTISTPVDEDVYKIVLDIDESLVGAGLAYLIGSGPHLEDDEDYFDNKFIARI